MTADETKAAADQALNDLAAGKPTTAMVCYTKCWECSFGEHRDPPQWHTWADDDDVAHAAATEQPDPRSSRCGCSCAQIGGGQ